MLQKKFKTLATISSFTNLGKSYILKQDAEGNITCNCPAWVFNHSRTTPRSCKHTNVITDQERSLEMLLMQSGKYDVLIDRHGEEWKLEKKI